MQESNKYAYDCGLLYIAGGLLYIAGGIGPQFCRSPKSTLMWLGFRG